MFGLSDITSQKTSEENVRWYEPVGETVFGPWEYFQVTNLSEIYFWDLKSRFFSGFF